MGMMQHPDTASTGQRAGPAFVKNAARPYHDELLAAAIFDVEGVLLASPHERAWREALLGLSDPARFTPTLYQADVAGKPRLDGARAALVALGVPDADRQAPAYAVRKQARLEELIRGGHVAAFPDALAFVQALRTMGWTMAVVGGMLLQSRSSAM